MNKEERYRKIRDGELEVPDDYDELVAFGKWCEDNQNPTPESPPVEMPPEPEIESQDLPVLEGITAYDLANKVIPPVNWFVPELIPEGLTVLAGDAKIGKSFLAWNLALAIAEGGIALQEIDIDEACSVTYFAFEDPELLLQERLQLMCPEGVPQNVHVLDHFFMRKFDPDNLQILSNFVDKTESQVVIVDTWGHVKPNPQIKGNTTYDNDYAAMIPVQRFAHERNIAVILVTHTTKGKDPDNPYNNLQGSMGMQAGCDTMLLLERDTDGHVLRAKGRRILDTEYAMNLTDGIWKIEGDSADFGISPKGKELLVLIRQNAQSGIIEKNLVDLTGRSQPAVNKSLNALARKDFVIRRDGRYYPVLK